MILVVFFILWLVLEIWTFVEIGGEIGGGTVVLWVFASAILGVAAIRRFAMPHIRRIGKDKENEALDNLFRAVCTVLAGIFLLLPGFVSDTLGALLIIPAIQLFCREFILDTVVGSYTFGLIDTEDLRDLRNKYTGRSQQSPKAPDFASRNVKDADFEVMDDTKKP